MVYQTIDLRIPRSVVTQSMNRLFGLDLKTVTVSKMKSAMAEYYKGAQDQILRKIITGNLLHVDETKVNLRGKSGFVWVFTNLQEVAYLYTETREGDMLKTLLAEFKGVLVSDFYAVYDAINCPQQKCLIHLIRDLNDDVLKNPFDDELKEIIGDFALLLKAMIETVDRYGLKKHFLRKHLVFVRRFYKRLSISKYQSEIAVKYQERFEKNRDKLFTFLSHDGIPWNNNNAEHAIKAFAALRDVIRGSSTDDGLQEYLILLTICETCKNRGIDFLDFLRSGEKDLDIFAGSRKQVRHAIGAASFIDRTQQTAQSEVRS